jgi:alpha-glucosidase
VKTLSSLAALALLLAAAACHGPVSRPAGRATAPLDTPAISVPPAGLNLHPFYKKYMNVNGIHVVSSWRVPDSCFYAARMTIKAMTDALSREVLDTLARQNTRIGIMARYEGTTDIPEHAHLAADTSLNWDLRARGLGGGPGDPFSTCAEENILAYQIDKYHAEDILVHEFSHTIHGAGILAIYPGFNDELRASLDAALAHGRWKNVYASTDIFEYWAEGVQNWFNVNAEVNNDAGDGKHNKINTREEMKRYDPTLHEIISRFFPEVEEQISRHPKVNLYDWKGE